MTTAATSIMCLLLQYRFLMVNCLVNTPDDSSIVDYLYLYLQLMSDLAFQLQVPISSQVSSRRFLKTLTDDESMTYCGSLFHSSIILFEKNVFQLSFCILAYKAPVNVLLIHVYPRQAEKIGFVHPFLSAKYSSIHFNQVPTQSQFLQ